MTTRGKTSRGISSRGELVIGPCTSLSEIAGSDLVREECPVLARAAGAVACPQVRNRATIGGNVCNASPAADTAVPLIVSDALLEIAVPGREEAGEVPACDFFTGPGETVLRSGELLVGIRIPLNRGANFSDYRKFGTRPAMEIAVVSVGVSMVVDNKTTEGAAASKVRVAFGSVAPVPLRGRRTEDRLEGERLDDKTIESACRVARDEISPISDVRASADYRREMTGTLLRRMLEDARQD